MSEIEKMKRYIERTKMKETLATPYSMSLVEAFELAKRVDGSIDLSVEILSLAFDYGKAKGYRAAKAERRAQA